MRFSSKNKHSYSTSVFFSTRDYGFKIYHKGTEYRSPQGEMKHHKKTNKLIRANKENFNLLSGKRRDYLYDVEKIGAHADKILRYEITFRHSYLCKIFWAKVFRYKDEPWQKRMAKWKEYRRIHEHIFGKAALKASKEKRAFWESVWFGRVNSSESFNRDMARQYQEKYKYVDLSHGLNKKQRLFYEWWERQKEKRISLNMRVSESVKSFNHHSFGEDFDIGDINKSGVFATEAWFSPKLLQECFKIFNKNREQFKIEQRITLNDAVNRADKYNKDVEAHNKLQIVKDGLIERRKKVYLGRMKPLLLLLQHHSLEYLIEHDTIPRSTAWDFEKRFKVIDLNFRMGSVENLWSCWSFNEYHSALQFDGLTPYLDNIIFG